MSESNGPLKEVSGVARKSGLSLDDAKDAVKMGGEFGEFFPLLAETDRAEFKTWFVSTPGVPALDRRQQVQGPSATGAAGAATPTTSARAKGYSGDICVRCGSDHVRRTGACLTCDLCGHNEGCG
jgi:hypothetical protein